MSTYRVSGARAYRGHPPGALFEARLESGAELRALRRGDIALVERQVPTLQPGSFELPRGWAHEHEEE